MLNYITRMKVKMLNNYCHSRLWNNIHQISYHSLTAQVLTWVDIWCKNKLSDSLPLQIQHLSHPNSLFVSVSPTHCLFLTSHPLLSLPIFPYDFWFFFLCLFYRSLLLFPASFSVMHALSALWHLPRRSQRGLGGIRGATSLFVDVGPAQLSSVSFVSDRRAAGKVASYHSPPRDLCFIEMHACFYVLNTEKEGGYSRGCCLSNQVHSLSNHISDIPVLCSKYSCHLPPST